MVGQQPAGSRGVLPLCRRTLGARQSSLLRPHRLRACRVLGQELPLSAGQGQLQTQRGAHLPATLTEHSCSACSAFCLEGTTTAGCEPQQQRLAAAQAPPAWCAAGQRAASRPGRRAQRLCKRSQQCSLLSAYAPAPRLCRVQVNILNYTKSQSPFWNQCHLSPVKDASGQVRFYVGLSHSRPHSPDRSPGVPQAVLLMANRVLVRGRV